MKKTRKLIECALLVAIAAVLSFVKLADLPYGGSVTAASMLPILIIAYRHGLGYGLGSGLVFAIIQQLMGLNNLSYVTGWKSVVAVIVLDYILAFAVLGFGGVFKGKLRHSGAELALGALLTCLVRYGFHVIAGATVWAGLSIPDSAALGYSFVYNATYMIPETIVLVIAGYYIASVMDFEKDIPVRKAREKGGVLQIVSGLILSAALIFDTVAVFSVLQDGETGEFCMPNIVNAPWLAIAIVSAVCVLVSAILFIIPRMKNKAN
ncbi:MAG: energy-coupled thiamine transporter ThiT [Clostridia bacterium]|nr:energy-coupled thiamine transporter ThiT [Clostridia bacterium]